MLAQLTLTQEPYIITYQPPWQVSSVSSLQKGNTPISKYLVLIWINILSGILMTDARVGELGGG